MSATRLTVSPRMRELMSYDKLAGEAPRMLVLESGYWLDAACVNAARGMGWATLTVSVPAKGFLPRESVEGLLLALARLRPDFILTINLSGMDTEGLFARLFEDLDIPYVTWFVDDPRTILMGRETYASSYAVALTWEDAYAGYLSAMGFPVVRRLPLAVDPTVFNADPAASWDYPPTFVGNSMTAFSDEEWAWANRHPELASAIHEAFGAQRVTRDNFAKGLAALLDRDLLEGLDEDQRRHIELLFFLEGTRRLRLDIVRLLGPEGLEVRGDDEWRQFFPEAGGAINYLHALPSFYRGCEINFNTTSIQMATAVNQRVFDCPAAGGFLLTDAQPDLCRLFDVEHETAVYHSRDECVDLLRQYRRHPAARRDIARRARKRILGEHTYAHRLCEIVAIIRERFCP